MTRGSNWLFGLTWALAGVLSSASDAAGQLAANEPAERPALVIEQDSEVRRQVVTLGRDLVVRGRVRSDVGVLNASARIDGEVTGDVVVIGGDAHLGPTARIHGDVFALGGVIEARNGSRVDGRSAAYPTASSSWLVLLEGPALGVSPGSRWVVGAKLALLASWVLVSLFFLAAFGGPLHSTSSRVRAEPLRSFFVGLVCVLAMSMTVLFFSTFAPVVVGVPLAVVVLLAALTLKLWGTVAVFHAVGIALSGRRAWRRQPIVLLLSGIGLLGLVKLVPWLGTWAWSAITLVGIGAALITKLGREEPWFSGVERSRTLP